jgi:CheY-like chemotaxis protein
MALRCIIVDDSPGFLRVASNLLRQDGICVVGVAATGEEAVACSRALRPDVALVDINLGEESGFTVVRELAEENGASARALILISTHAEEELAELIEASPAVGFLAKSDVGAAAIESLLARARADQGGG